MEKQTGKNYIVSAFTQNKLCPKGALLRSKGDQTATYPGGHTGCIANVDKLESLSEYESRREIGRNIAGAGVTVAYCTTDGDSRLPRLFQTHILVLTQPGHSYLTSQQAINYPAPGSPV